MQQPSDKPRAILLNTSTKIPLLWKVIANKYNHRMKFGSFHDDGGSYFGGLGVEDNSKSDKRVVFFGAGSTDPVLYEGERASATCRGSTVVLTLCRYSEAKGVVGVHRFSYQRPSRPDIKEESCGPGR